MLGLGWPELLIILVVALLLFGGTRLAGVGKGTGRAIREFKEETQSLRGDEDKKKAAAEQAAAQQPGALPPATPQQTAQQPVQQPAAPQQAPVQRPVDGTQQN